MCNYCCQAVPDLTGQLAQRAKPIMETLSYDHSYRPAVVIQPRGTNASVAHWENKVFV